MSDQTILTACKAGSEAWKKAFNRQDAKGCAEQYNENATMHAKPFGVFEGRAVIQDFWADIIQKGFNEVAYTDVVWQKHGDHGYVLSSSWTMNKAFGVVHQEHWVVETDGYARIIFDEFEVQGER